MFKYTMIIVNYDVTVDVDQMYPEYRNMRDAKKKMDQTICKCMSVTIDRATRSVERELGMTSLTYKQKKGEKKMMEEIQGKINVPQRTNLQKDQMIQANTTLSKDVELYLPDMKARIKHHGVTFSKDRIRHVTGDTKDKKTARDLSECVKNTQKSVQMWYNLTRFNGGLMALHKTNW